MPAEEEQLTLKLNTSFNILEGADGFIAIVPLKGLVQRGKISWEEWWEALRRMDRARKTFQKAIGDHIHNGRADHGDALVDEALGEMEFAVFEVERAEAIAKIPWSSRDPEKLEDNHYYVAGAADLTENERVVWLETAIKQHLDPVELRRSIEAGKVVKTENTPGGRGAGTGINTIEEVRNIFMRWSRQNLDRMMASDIDKKRKLLAEVQPIADMIDKLRADIAAAESPPDLTS